MNKFLGIAFGSLILAIGLCIAVFASTPSPVRPDEHGARNWTNLSTLVAAAGTTNIVQFDIDGGAWDITENLTISSNITLKFYPGSYFNITAGKTVTLQDCGLIAGPNPIVKGAGTMVGTANYEYEWSEWGVGTTKGFEHNIDVDNADMGTSAITKLTVNTIDLTPAKSQTVNLTSNMSSATIQALINGVGKYVASGRTVSFQFADGTYTNLEARLDWNGFYGGGSTFILGNAAGAGAARTNHAVTLNFTNVGNKISGIGMHHNSCDMQIRHIKIIADPDEVSEACLRIVTTESPVLVDGCAFICADTNIGSGVYASPFGNVVIERCAFAGGIYGAWLRNGQFHMKDNATFTGAPLGLNPQTGIFMSPASWLSLFDATSYPTGIVTHISTNGGSFVSVGSSGVQ